jgi:hypothetical protein
MKTLQDYLAESEQWMHTPAEGDSFAIELPDEVLCETYVLEVVDDCILLDSTEQINRALAECAALEDTDEGESGVILETMGYGTLVGEEELNEFLPALAAGAARALATPFVRGAIAGSTLAGGDDEVKEGSMKHEMHKAAERMSLAQFKDRYGDEDWIEEFWRVSVGEPKRADDPIAPARTGGWSPERMIAAKSKGVWTGSVDEDQDAAVVAGKEAAIDAAQGLAMDEAEYQGRKVALGKPMQGDVKKFKVYVKDPATGNIKKVNFGDKTMRIKKSNPARRKSFRARHNCANPGPRTKARYWSCRKW